MIDIHCHVLPEVDDGAKSWEIAVEMCRMANEDGIEHIVATPHANDEFRYDRESHEQKLEQLRQRIQHSLQLSLGCDFHFSFDNIQLALKDPSRYCIGNTHYLLVEFSDYGIPSGTARLLTQFLERGITPIITHPERNPVLQRNPDMVLEWASIGALVQVTANSLTGRWGTTARKTIDYLIRRRGVHIVASDAHGLNSRPPILSEARSTLVDLVGLQYADALVNDNPRAVVEDRPLSMPSTLS